MAREKRLTWMLGAVVSLLCTEMTAWGFERAFSSHGAYLSWPTPRLTVRLPATRPHWEGALRAAVASWQSPACTNLRMDIVDVQSSAPVNIEIEAVEEPWPHDGSVAAFTRVDSEPMQGIIQRVHIQLRGNILFHHGSGPPASNQIDLRSVLTHELGHALGLAHSRNRHAVMRAGILPGTAPHHTLHPDDVNAVCALYPRSPRP